ncbi:MAG: hypothetical protein HY298_21465 [Verrucomicrobia bacterium]|nr:hypothetical protein [Verrucomicrobiota bacterium]
MSMVGVGSRSASQSNPDDFKENALRTAAEQRVGSTAGLTAMDGVDYGETQSASEGQKDGNRVEATFDPTGKRVPWEKRCGGGGWDGFGKPGDNCVATTANDQGQVHVAYAT